MTLSSKLVLMEVINSINRIMYTAPVVSTIIVTYAEPLHIQQYFGDKKRISKWAYLTVTHLSKRLSASFKGASEISLYIKSKRDEQCTR